MSEISERYQRMADDFAGRIDAVPDDRWSSPSPCRGWDARGVVEHVVGAQAMFLGFIDAEPETTVDVATDPAGAFAETSRAMAAALEDPEQARREYDSPLGRSVFEESADRFVTNDLLLHGWDLAVATGGDTQLDAEQVVAADAAYRALGDMPRQNGVFGPAVEAPPGADAQDRLLAYTGRDPAWTPDGP